MTRAAAQARRIGWTLHGARACVESRSEEALAYARAHLRAAGTAPEPAEIRIRLGWQWGAAEAGLSAGEGAERVGKDLFERDGRLLWTRVPGFEGLALEAGRSEGRVIFGADCRYAPRDALARVRYLRPSRRAKKTHRTFFKLMYYGAYYPMVWLLERTRGWGLLHASAVERDGRAVILSGFGGVGKSTLALSLLADPSFRFVSDNLILHDEERVYALPEPVRLDASSVAAVRSAGFEPSRSDVPPTAHPKPTYWVDETRTSDGGAAEVLILLRFTPRSLIRPLGPEEALAHLTAARDLVKEVEGCRSVAAFLSMAAAREDDRPAEPARLAALVRKVRAYLLGIGQGEPVAVTLARIREVCA